MPVEPRPEALATPACPHGVLPAVEAAALGLSVGEVLDFSASCHPRGAAPAVLEALAAVDPAPYPPEGAGPLRAAIARSLDLDPNQVLVGAGSTEVLWLVGLAYLRPDDEVLIIGPTFGEAARVAALYGARVTELRAEPSGRFVPPVQQAVQWLGTRRPRLLFLCNPNNPTGAYLERAQVEALVDRAPDTLVVIDEAYAPFVTGRWDARPLAERDHVLLLRSLTKDHGLAGLRLGYGIADPAIVAALDRVRPPWNVSAPALAAGLAALAAPEHADRGREETARAREFLASALASLGLEVVPARANFLLVRVGNGADFRRRLLGRGYCVRDCASFGLPQYVRIGMRGLDDCRRLAREVGVMLEEQSDRAR